MKKNNFNRIFFSIKMSFKYKILGFFIKRQLLIEYGKPYSIKPFIFENAEHFFMRVDEYLKIQK
jgi:hypothetical protein